MPDAAEPLPGGQGGPGGSVRAGDLVLSPGRDTATALWLNPVLARLAVGLDERPGRRRRDLRIAMPVPARDGSWVVQGWGASRWEPGTEACRDLEVILATGRLLHAELASVVGTRPVGLEQRTDRWARAERLAFGPLEDLPDTPVVNRAAALLAEAPHGPALGPDQLVHADLAVNVLLDVAGAPVVIDVSPAWRPVRWAEAVCVLDAVMWLGADPQVLVAWRNAAGREAMLRAVLFRVLGEEVVAEAAYDKVLDAIAG